MIMNAFSTLQQSRITKKSVKIRILKTKHFIKKYKYKGINYPARKDSWKKFYKNNPTIALNVLYVEKINTYLEISFRLKNFVFLLFSQK